MNNSKDALEKSFNLLKPYSDLYRSDAKRFLHSLEILEAEGILKTGKRVLDIGSGIGIMSVAMRQIGCSVESVDKFIFPEEEENMFLRKDEFKSLKKIWDGQNIKINSIDIEEGILPYDDNSFDIVNFDATIEHFVNSPKNLLIEILRILNQGGVLIVTTPNLANLLRRIRFVFGLSPNWDLGEYFNEGKNFRGHRREFTLSEVKKMLLWTGFEIQRAETRNVFFNAKRLIHPKKFPAHLSSLLSTPLKNSRELIYVVAKKPSK